MVIYNTPADSLGGGGAKPGEILSTELSELRTVDGQVA